VASHTRVIHPVEALLEDIIVRSITSTAGGAIMSAQLGDASS
jgi:hypothetical protein